MRVSCRRVISVVIITYCVGFVLLQTWTGLFLGPTSHNQVNFEHFSRRERKLGVVVPVSSWEISRAVNSLRRWPTECSEEIVHKIDLILHYTRSVEIDLQPTLELVKDSLTCFGSTKIISLWPHQEEIAYETVRSVQFYQLFLDPDIRAQIDGYDALAIIDWEMVIPHASSFESLYSHAFGSGCSFWVKGSRLPQDGIEYIDTLPEGLHKMGHLNGNALYNNTDPAFFDYINFTRNRWGLAYAYDVALWTTVSDYPYSWPLWQRYGSKFVAINMVSVTGSREREKADNGAFDSEPLFFRERVEDSGDKTTRLDGCKEACGRGRALNGSLSSFCDPKCLGNEVSRMTYFNGYNCGAGNHAEFGKACRPCFDDLQAALAADEALTKNKSNSSRTNEHVIMCSTKRPPEAKDCPRKCSEDVNTVCDNRCGSGLYRDWHCNWRNMGDKCRFCFHDATAAQLGDEFARKKGGRVIMCDTHEPTQLDGDVINTNNSERGIRHLTGNGARDANMVAIGATSVSVSSALAKQPTTTVGSTSSVYPEPPVDLPAVTFPHNITHGHICVFIPGYFEFFHETSISLLSIQEFMPGVRVSIACHPMDFHVFNRAFARERMVSVSNSSHPGYAALEGDMTCGKETKFIYYMNPGDILTRPFTAKDTVSPRGELLVHYADVGLVGGESTRRTMASKVLLGFQSPSFTEASDLILPVTVNAQLRLVLLESAQRLEIDLGADEHPDDKHNFDLYYRTLDSVLGEHLAEISIYIPDLLAAILFSQDAEGVKFIKTGQWEIQTPFPEMSIWDVSLVKPRFGCTMDISRSLRGFDIATQLQRRLESFRLGARCDRGFVAVDPTSLKLKSGLEFPTDRSGSIMPSLTDYRVSVIYRSFKGDAELFRVSLPTVIKHISTALEVVVVVEEEDENLFEKLVAPHRELAPFPLRVVTEPSLMDGHTQQEYSKVRADLYTEGDFILHLDSDAVVFDTITYEHIFHFGKPVIPFRRHRDDKPEGDLCWRNSRSDMIGEDLMHDFSFFTTHAYPRSMYPALRTFIEERNGMSLEDFFSQRRGKCWSPTTLSNRTLEVRPTQYSIFNVMRAFLWYHMYDSVHWLAADPWDLQPDQWRPDLSKYAAVCESTARSFPNDDPGKVQYETDILSVRSSDHCNSVVQYWQRKKNLNN